MCAQHQKMGNRRDENPIFHATAAVFRLSTMAAAVAAGVEVVRDGDAPSPSNNAFPARVSSSSLGAGCACLATPRMREGGGNRKPAISSRMRRTTPRAASVRGEKVGRTTRPPLGRSRPSRRVEACGGHEEDQGRGLLPYRRTVFVAQAKALGDKVRVCFCFRVFMGAYVLRPVLFLTNV